MARVVKFAVAFGFAASAAAQSSTITAPPTTGGGAQPTGEVINLTFPADGNIDSQVLVGSLVGSSGQVTTVVVGCPEGEDSNDCGFPTPFTVEAGPSTLHFVQTFNDIVTFTIEQDCQYTSGQGGQCTNTFIGPPALANENIPTDLPTESLTGVTTTSTSSSFDESDLVTQPVTITAGAVSTSGGSSPTTTSRGSNASSTTRSGSGTSPTTNAAVAPTGLAPGWIGAAALGFAAVMV